MALTSAGVATPIAFVDTWTINFSTDKADVTAMGDTNKVYVAGLPDAQGTFAGSYDDATVQAYTAAIDGIARPMYLYTDLVNDPAQYWYGTILPDFSVSGGVGDPLKFTSSWNAAGAVTKIG